MNEEIIKNIIKEYSEKNPQCNLTSEGTYSDLAEYIADRLLMNGYHIMSDYDIAMLDG